MRRNIIGGILHLCTEAKGKHQRTILVYQAIFSEAGVGINRILAYEEETVAFSCKDETDGSKISNKIRMASPNRMPSKEITKICRYISGLLSYYGVMKLDELHRRVQLLFECSTDLAKFRAQLKRKSLDDLTDEAMFDVVGDEIHH